MTYEAFGRLILLTIFDFEVKGPNTSFWAVWICRWRSSVENVFDLDAKVSEIDPCIGKKKYSIFSIEYFWAMLSQVSVEHDNNYWVNCVKSQDCRRTLAGEARTKAGNDTYLLLIWILTIVNFSCYYHFRSKL